MTPVPQKWRRMSVTIYLAHVVSLLWLVRPGWEAILFVGLTSLACIVSHVAGVVDALHFVSEEDAMDDGSEE